MSKVGALRLVRLRRKTYTALEGGLVGNKLTNAIHIAIVSVILISVLAVILESVPTLHLQYGALFHAIEIVAVSLFTFEYCLRLWASVEHAPLRGKGALQARWSYARSPAMLVDLIAILPFFLAYFSPDDLKVLLIFRLMRFFKLTRYSPGMHSLKEAVMQERRALLACLVILCGLVIVAASAMHMAEASAQPDKFGSIPESMWWAIITLTTVGYGDVVPITAIGKLIASITALGGLVMLALPVGIIATSFAEVIRRREFVVTWAMISRLPIFENMHANTVGELLQVMRSQMVQTGDVIIRKGDAGDRMYLVASGRVEVILPGDNVILAEGEYFGEEGVLLNLPRRATVRALEPTRLLALDRADVEALIEREPGLKTDIDAMMHRRGSPGVETP
jgi:voltage-gated potassium channel